MTRQQEWDFGVAFLDDIITWIRDNLSSEDVFGEPELTHWAETNGFIEE